MQIIFYLFSRGDSEDGITLSDLGERQVNASAKAHLSEINFFEFISCGEGSARGTLDAIIDNTQSNFTSRQIDPAFGWDWSKQVYPKSGDDAERAYQEATSIFGSSDMLSILQARPRLWQLRGSMLTGILGAARELAIRVRSCSKEKKFIHILIATHPFLAALCASNPLQNWMRPADIMRLQIDVYIKKDEEIGQENVMITESTLLRCPPIDDPY